MLPPRPDQDEGRRMSLPEYLYYCSLDNWAEGYGSSCFIQILFSANDLDNDGIWHVQGSKPCKICTTKDGRPRSVGGQSENEGTVHCPCPMTLL